MDCAGGAGVAASDSASRISEVMLPHNANPLRPARLQRRSEFKRLNNAY